MPTTGVWNHADFENHSIRIYRLKIEESLTGFKKPFDHFSNLWNPAGNCLIFVESSKSFCNFRTLDKVLGSYWNLKNLGKVFEISWFLLESIVLFRIVDVDEVSELGNIIQSKLMCRVWISFDVCVSIFHFRWLKN